jgi:hypothetical protein
MLRVHGKPLSQAYVPAHHQYERIPQYLLYDTDEVANHSVVSGDLFSKKTEVQNQIEGYFALASRWGCFMLIDDADAQVFVGKKPPGQHPEQIQVMTGMLISKLSLHMNFRQRPAS